MLRHLSQPLHPWVLVGRIRLAGSDINLARDGLVDDGLPLLLQMLDQPFLGADGAPDAPVGVVEEADDRGLFVQRWHATREVSEVSPRKVLTKAGSQSVEDLHQVIGMQQEIRVSRVLGGCGYGGTCRHS